MGRTCKAHVRVTPEGRKVCVGTHTLRHQAKNIHVVKTVFLKQSLPCQKILVANDLLNRGRQPLVQATFLWGKLFNQQFKFQDGKFPDHVHMLLRLTGAEVDCIQGALVHWVDRVDRMCQCDSPVEELLRGSETPDPDEVLLLLSRS